MLPVTPTPDTATSRLVDTYYAHCEAILARATADGREVTFNEAKKLKELSKAAGYLLKCAPRADTKDTIIFVGPKRD